MQFDRVLAKYETALAPTFNNTILTVVNYATAVYDPWALVATGAGWVFTAPRQGFYQIYASLMFQSYNGWADGESSALYIYLNGTPISIVDRQDLGSASAIFRMMHGATLVNMAAGDTLQVRAVQNSGANLNLHNQAAYNYVDIFLVK